MDPGSIVLAGFGASLIGLATLVLLRRGRETLDLPTALGVVASADASTAFVAGAVALIALGVGWAFVFATAWALADLPVNALTGAAFGVARWIAAEAAAARLAGRAGRTDRAILRPRGESLAILGSHVVYGAAVGELYRPGS